MELQALLQCWTTRYFHGLLVDFPSRYDMPKISSRLMSHNDDSHRQANRQTHMYCWFGFVCIGLLSMVYANSGLCGSPLCIAGQSCAGCPVDYSPVILPSIIGGFLVVIGTWVCFVRRPNSSPRLARPSRADNVRSAISTRTVLESSDRIP
jgi:hypothetical protein